MKYFTHSTVETFVLGLVYLDRIAARGAPLCRSNAFRLFAGAMTASSKFHDEHHHKNRYLARVFGVTTAELAALECEFLTRIRFDLVVDPAEFELYRVCCANLALAAASGALVRCTVIDQQQQQEQEQHCISDL